MRKNKQTWQTWGNLSLVFLASVLALKALWHPGLYTAHDIWHQVARFYHYSQAFFDGHFPPTWISTLAQGHGYPLFFFSYHLPWLIGLPLVLIGLDIFTSLKLLFFGSVFFSGLTIYGFSQRVFKDQLAALLTAVIYIWAPYHFLTIFVSAAIGTAFVFVFLPLLIWGIYEISEYQSVTPNSTKGKLAQQVAVKGIVLTAIGAAGILLSHLMSLVILAPVIGFFILGLAVLKKRKKNQLMVFAKNLLLAAGLTLGLTAFYWLPMVKYLDLIKAQEQSGFTDIYKANLLNFKQLVYSRWGFGPIIENAKNGEICFQLGIIQWLGVGLAGLLVLLKKYSKKITPLMILLVSALVLSLFLMIDQSKAIWQWLNSLVTLDYPWRLLLLAVFWASLIAGSVVSVFKNKILRVSLLIAFLSVAWYTNRNHVRVNQYTDIPLDLYVRSETTTNTFHEYLPKQASSDLLSQEEHSVVPESVQAKNTLWHTNAFQQDLMTEEIVQVSVQQFAFPGQRLYLDGKPIDYQIDGKGRINFELPSGEHQVLVKFTRTPVVWLSQLISLGFLFLLISHSFRLWQKQK